MKTLKSIFLLAVIIGIASCKKEALVNETHLLEKNDQSAEYNLKSSGNNPYELLLRSPNDPDDEKIKRQLNEIGLVGRELFKTTRFNEWIITEAQKRDNSSVPLTSFIAYARTIATNDEKIVLDRLEPLVNNVDLTHRSLNPQNAGTVEEYIAAIFVPNVYTCSASETHYVSAGIYLNDEIPAFKNYRDHIIAWKKNAQNGFEDIFLNEETTNSISNPVFVFDNAEEEITYRSKSGPLDDPIIASKSGPESAWYSSHEYQINHRYDNSTHSEFCITGAHIDHTGTVRLICRKSNGTFDLWKKVADVHKNNVGKLLYKWEQFCNNTVVPFNSNFVFWNTYERDWAKSEKSLGSATRNGKTIYLSGRRTYSSEWYAYDPNQLNNNPVDFNTIYYTWAKWHNNSKGRFRIWRIES